MISFTGSTSAGMAMSEMLPNNKREYSELGGKSANVVLEDADVIRAAKSSISACLQTLVRPVLRSLDIVPESKISEMIPVIVERVSKYKLETRWILQPAVDQWSLQSKKCLEYIRSGITEGATLVAGGPEDVEGIEKGHFVRPTVFKT